MLALGISGITHWDTCTFCLNYEGVVREWRTVKEQYVQCKQSGNTNIYIYIKAPTRLGKKKKKR